MEMLHVGKSGLEEAGKSEAIIHHQGACKVRNGSKVREEKHSEG